MKKVIKLNAPFERIRFENNTPDAKLRMAIITQAMIDATTISTNEEDKKVAEDAIEWIFGKNEEFVNMCYAIGLEPDYIARRTKEGMIYQRDKILNHFSAQESKAFEKF
ncbi:MAG: hypothetical protein SFT91_04140 [Rickettsiaceae bacterium]|nr:hypothetical protein [Rickettsiaceae bacterium]